VGLLKILVAAGEFGPVLVLSGEADMTSAAELNDALAAQLSRGAQHLTADVTALRFADSASIRALVLTARALKERGGNLVLVSPQPPVALVLSLTGADQLLTIRLEADAEAEPEGA
jgi:stage II sporulation protein AA (anti-sigma F factor antagonist)